MAPPARVPEHSAGWYPWPSMKGRRPRGKDANPREALAGLRIPLALLGGAIVLGLAFVAWRLLFTRPDGHELQGLYAIARELRRDMTRGEVLAVVGRHEEPALERLAQGDASLSLIVRYGLGAACLTEITFEGGRLKSA